jgi:DNA-binding GntR family transcriptional regulator
MATADEVAADLRRRILGGRCPLNERPADALAPNDELPPTRALAETAGCANQTVTNALAQLEREGLIKRRPRMAPRVVPPRPAQTIHACRFRPSERNAPDGSYTYERQVGEDWDPWTEYVHVGPVPAPEWARIALELLPEGEAEAVERRRVRWAAPRAEGRAVRELTQRIGLFTSYVPVWVARAVPAVLTRGKVGVGGSYSRIEEVLGLDEEGEEAITMRMATLPEAEAFDWSAPDWVVQVDRVIRSDGRPVTTDREVWLPGFVEFRHPLPLRG